MSARDPKQRRWPRRFLWMLIGLAVLWLLGDAGYAWYVSRAERAWEASLERDAEGVQAGCQEFRMGTGDTAVLFVHGINDSPRVWQKIIPVVAAADTTCVAVRLPGFAEPTPDYATATRVDWMQAVQEETERLQQTHERVIVVAHSLGAAITLRLIQAEQINPTGVVFIAPAVAVSDDRSPGLPTRTWHWLANRLLLFTHMTMNPYGVDAHDPAERNNEFRTPFTPRTTIDEVFALMDANRAHQEPFPLPLNVILAADDHVISNQAATRFFEAATGVPKQLLIVEDSAHMIPVDLEWKQVARVIVEFVERLEAQPASQEPPAEVTWRDVESGETWAWGVSRTDSASPPPSAAG